MSRITSLMKGAAMIDGGAVLERVLRHRNEAVAALDRHAVPVWLFLAERFRSTADVRSDHFFQFLFRSYYRLDNAGLTETFKAAYFRLLQEHRGGPRPVPNPLQLLRRFCNVLARYGTRKGKNALHFSFATKLLATLDPEQPVYDSFVASVCRFRRPDHLKDRSERLDRLLRFYESLSEACRWLGGQPEFGAVSQAFANRHQGWRDVPP
jgi:hypothetical protein